MRSGYLLKLPVIITVIFWCFHLFTLPAWASTVTTDKNAYYLGEEVTISGTVNNPDLDKVRLEIKSNNVNVPVVDHKFNYAFTDTDSAGTYNLSVKEYTLPHNLIAETSFEVRKILAPQPSPHGGSYSEYKAVSLSCRAPYDAIYYTTDGTDPKSSSTAKQYSSPIVIEEDTRLKAVTVKDSEYSEVISEKYEIEPEIETYFPEDGEKDVSLDTSITVTFNRAMEEATLKDHAHFYIKQGADKIDGEITYDSASKTLTFTPDELLEPDKKYRVYLTDEIEGSDGKEIDDEEWDFRTKDGMDIEIEGNDLEPDETKVYVTSNPVNITVYAPDAIKLTVNSEEPKKEDGEYELDLPINSGTNNVVIEANIDDYSLKREVEVIYPEILKDGIKCTIDFPDSGPASVFNDQVKIEFPQDAYLVEDDSWVEENKITLELHSAGMIEKHSAVGLEIEITPEEKGSEPTEEGTITLPYDEDVSDSAAHTLTVFFNNGSGWKNLGGKVNTENNTITTKFKTFGRYVVVNRAWTFNDDYSLSWARYYLEYLYAQGAMEPLPNQRPDIFGLVDSAGRETPITRGEFVVIISKALDLPLEDDAGHMFHDLIERNFTAYAMQKNGSWEEINYEKLRYIESAARNGIINGFSTAGGNQRFQYFDYITREQVAAVLARVTDTKVTADYDKVFKELQKAFADSEQISNWAQPYVVEMNKEKIFEGFPDKTFKPQQYFTRAQASKTIYTLMEKINII